MLVEQGQTIGEEQLILLRMEHEAAIACADLRRAGADGPWGSSPSSPRSSSSAATTSAGTSREIVGDLSRIATICGLVVLGAGRRPAAGRPSPGMPSWSRWPSRAMIVAIAYNPHFALMVTFGLSLLTCIALGTGISHFLVIMGGTAAGVLTLNEVRTRTKLIKVGATAALDVSS